MRVARLNLEGEDIIIEGGEAQGHEGVAFGDGLASSIHVFITSWES